jgi:predicted dehydrogenase
MPEPSYLYQPDGFFFDLWYPLQMLVSLFGAIKQLSATSYSNPRARYSVSGQSIPINTPTYVSSVLEFEQNIFVTLVFNIDVLGTSMFAVEIHGTHGIIQAPSPYTWADLAWYKQLSPQKYRIQNLRQPPLPAKRWREYLRQFMKDPRNRWNAIPQSKDAFTSRGCGVAEMSQAILENHPHRTSLDMGIHILEAVLSIQKSAELGIRLDLSTTVARPEPISR